ncbi:LPXTG cell wall anchor domain-containing protein [Eubacteriales bacterium OttesenSCG-928-M02]|nr:LPXTG cell wall anchor domain-containing protein [Eubacteriales bacterium OttesenSCG-928-M02]
MKKCFSIASFFSLCLLLCAFPATVFAANSPTTGDDSNIAMWLGLLAIVGVALIGFFVARLKAKRDEEKAVLQARIEERKRLEEAAQVGTSTQPKEASTETADASSDAVDTPTADGDNPAEEPANSSETTEDTSSQTEDPKDES